MVISMKLRAPHRKKSHVTYKIIRDEVFDLYLSKFRWGR